MTTNGKYIAAILAGVGLAACASSKGTSWADVQPPTAYVDVLPPGAIVSVDGREVGRAPLEFPVPDDRRSCQLRVTSPGFEPLEFTLAGAPLAGGRLDLVLRPEGFGSQRVLQGGEPTGLLQAAVALLRSDRPREAIAFAQASLALGDAAAPHRVIGLAWKRLGNRDLAVKELSIYVSQAPDAPDRKEIEQVIASLARDIEMSPARPPKG